MMKVKSWIENWNQHYWVEEFEGNDRKGSWFNNDL